MNPWLNRHLLILNPLDKANEFGDITNQLKSPNPSLSPLWGDNIMSPLLGI